jgi:hypothetical protein
MEPKINSKNTMRAVREDLISSCKEVNLGFDGISPCRGVGGVLRGLKEEMVQRGGGTSSEWEQRLLAVDDSRPDGASFPSSSSNRKETDMDKPMDERICPIIKGQCIKDDCRFWIEIDGFKECAVIWISDVAIRQDGD